MTWSKFSRFSKSCFFRILSEVVLLTSIDTPMAWAAAKREWRGAVVAVLAAGGGPPGGAREALEGVGAMEADRPLDAASTSAGYHCKQQPTAAAVPNTAASKTAHRHNSIQHLLIRKEWELLLKH